MHVCEGHYNTQQNCYETIDLYNKTTAMFPTPAPSDLHQVQVRLRRKPLLHNQQQIAWTGGELGSPRNDGNGV